MALHLHRVLIVTYYFPPSAASGSFRMLGFARNLPKYGWQSIVVAPPTLPWEPADPVLRERVPGETIICEAPYRRSAWSRPFRKLAPYASWLPGAMAVCRRAVREHRPDAVLTSGPPHGVHLIGAILKRWHAIPWIADFRDPWVTGSRPEDLGALRARLEARLERLVLGGCDRIVMNTEAGGELIRDAYPALAGKVAAIPNGYDPEAFGTRSKSGADDPLNILHAGAIYYGRDPRPFLEALQAVRRDGRVPMRASFLGLDSGFTVDLRAEIRRRGLDGVVAVEGQVPYAQTLQRMVDADLLLLLDTPGRRVGVPAKLYEYVGAGRPVLALGSAEGDLAWVLRESGVPHRIASPGDVEAIRCSLLELADVAVGGGLPAADETRRRQFTREGTAGRMAGLLDDCQVS